MGSYGSGGFCAVRVLFLLGCLMGSIQDSGALDFLDASGEEIKDCDYDVDLERRALTAVYMNCTKLEHNKHHLRFRLQFNNMTATGPEDVTYNVDCDAVQADESSFPSGFTSVTNCTKDFMTVAFPRLSSSIHDVYATESQMEWIVSIDYGRQTRRLSLKQAIQQGSIFITEDSAMAVKVPLQATGVVTYKQDDRVLYTTALKLTYGPPEQQLTMESRMICAPGPVTCNSTHMTVTVPAFPGALAAMRLDNRNILLDQRQVNGISIDTSRGVKLYISKRALKSRLYRDDSCSGFQSYASSLKLDFNYHGKVAAMVTYPECPCEQTAPLVAVCTRDGHMAFEIANNSTKPSLNLDSLKLKDPACKPVFRSPSNDVVRFYIPLNGCGTMQKFNGERTLYENEVAASWADLPPRAISRDSEFRLTVICSYGNDDASLNVEISSLPSPASVTNQGPLSLILLIYPDASYLYPYSDDQYPIVKYLRQPIFLEVQVLNRNDPNIHLMLDDCWATPSLDPASLPRWNIMVDGCDYELDNYKTVFHPVGPEVTYHNFRQRFEVKAFAFVSGGKALPSLVYFHCSVLICDRFHPDSPLCSTGCPLRPSRKRRDVMPMANSALVTLLHPVILVPKEQLEITGQEEWNEDKWITCTLMAAVVLGLLGIVLAIFNWCKIPKRTLRVN
ncbi:zona pellucida sperm-binding protein 2 isoform X2 [Rhineura floridana]|uniref:zona pellucida sperm-binding protein 2 isoform X2 n=1 Tax=Rhineura floridana TaxID=261503 RepID=UPI002AC7F40F|nr:zona pellucida sperm-binding protein 2 isoform X2 [Rhineura floridana]